MAGERSESLIVGWYTRSERLKSSAIVKTVVSPSYVTLEEKYHALSYRSFMFTAELFPIKGTQQSRLRYLNLKQFSHTCKPCRPVSSFFPAQLQCPRPEWRWSEPCSWSRTAGWTPSGHLPALWNKEKTLSNEPASFVLDVLCFSPFLFLCFSPFYMHLF